MYCQDLKEKNVGNHWRCLEISGWNQRFPFSPADLHLRRLVPGNKLGGWQGVKLV